MAGILCDVLECVGCYYIIGAICNKSQGRPATQGLCGCGNNNQQQNTGVYSNAPQRQQFYHTATPVAQPVSRPAQYQRTSNVLGSKQQPPPPTSNNNRGSSAMNGTGYRLSDGAAVTHSTTNNNNNIAPPAYTTHNQHDHSVPVAAVATSTAAIAAHNNNNSENLTLSEQLESMPEYSVTLIKKILMNAIDSDSASTQKRRIKLSNDKIQSQIVSINGALEILEKAGFVVSEVNPANDQVINNNQHMDNAETYLVFPDNGDKYKLNETLEYLNQQRADVPSIHAKTMS